jgi:hypothetical protein
VTTAVQDRLVISPEEARQYLRVDTTVDDALIADLVMAASASADAFLNNPFTDADDDPLPIPMPVRVWVLRRAATLYESRLEAARVDDVAGLGMVDYGVRDEGGAQDFSLLRPFRLNPGL